MSPTARRHSSHLNRRPRSGGVAQDLLRDRAYADLRARIMSGELEAGSVLSERMVASWLKMSKTPIRAAFGRLELEGFVVIAPQQGVMVKGMSLDEVVDHFELREALEPYVAEHVAGRLTTPQREQLEANLSAQEQAMLSRDVPRSVTLDSEFHQLLCECLGNREIQRVIFQIRDRIQRVIQRVHLKHPERIATNYPEHRAIAQAIIDGDGDLAGRRMKEHLEHGKQLLLSPRSSLKPTQPVGTGL